MTEQNSNKELPTKTGSIEKLVTVPQDVEKVIKGQKTATRRNGRYADIGEVMTLEGHQFIIENVYRQTLGELTNENAKKEGYETVEEYKNSILSSHPGMPWSPDMKVWVHEYAPIKK